MLQDRSARMRIGRQTYRRRADAPKLAPESDPELGLASNGSAGQATGNLGGPFFTCAG